MVPASIQPFKYLSELYKNKAMNIAYEKDKDNRVEMIDLYKLTLDILDKGLENNSNNIELLSKKINPLYSLAKLYSNEYSKARGYFLQAIRIANEIYQTNQESSTILNKVALAKAKYANFLRDNGEEKNYTESEKYYLEAIELFTKAHESSKTITSILNIGGVNFEYALLKRKQKDLNKAIELLKIHLDILEKNTPKRLVMFEYFKSYFRNMSILLPLMLEVNEDPKEYVKRSIKIANTICRFVGLNHEQKYYIQQIVDFYREIKLASIRDFQSCKGFVK